MGRWWHNLHPCLRAVTRTWILVAPMNWLRVRFLRSRFVSVSKSSRFCSTSDALRNSVCWAHHRHHGVSSTDACGS